MSVPSIDLVRQSVEQTMGGRVSDIQRQNRWRPTWFVDLDRDGETVPLVVRGDRFDANSLPLRHEYEFHRLVWEGGARVPSLHAFLRIGALDAMIMERVPGKATFGDLAAEDRDTVVDEYLQQLALIHAMDPAKFLAAGIEAPAPGEDPGEGRIRQKIENFRATKNAPEPFSEFVVGWLMRNKPNSRRPAAPALLDTGQFHHKDGRLVAVLDLEFGQLSDPMIDLAVWRMRDTLIPFGDMQKLYARYEELTGQPVDMDAIKWHLLGGAIGNALMFAPAVAKPEPETDIMTYMQWDSETNLMSAEFLGEVLDIELPVLDIPPVEPNRDQVTFAHLIRQLGSVTVGDHNQQHQLRLCFRMARHLHRRNEIGVELDRQDVDDVNQLLGTRLTDWNEATVELEKFVVADANTGAHDRALTVLFYKRLQRVHMTMGPQGSSMTRHYQCQRFDGKPTRIIQY
jgi:aminoglycoside phosphotransferase (APT) family kinase protein